MAKTQVAKINWWHEQLADWMLANPEKTLGEAAKHFDISQAWLSVVKNSDSFKDYWAKRRSVIEAGVAGSIVDKTCAMTELALDRMLEKMENMGDALSIKQLQSIADMGLKRMGYGASKNTPAPVVNVNLGSVDPAGLERARQLMQAHHGVLADPPLELTAEEVPADATS